MQTEQEKLALVKEEILAKVAVLGESLATKRTGVLDVRKEMWREARIVLRDFDDVADLSIFAEEVARHETQYVQASEEIKKLGKMLESPYFARIDFAEVSRTSEKSSNEVSYEAAEQIYIGRNSLFDEKKYAFHVYDWRAPISGLYYDFGTGAAEFTVPTTGAIISGEISLKRQYQIENGELLYMFDNDIAIEDDILRLELSKASEARIKAIINTIQTDQNRAIRSEAGDILVYGPAGCGKTSVGLHRLAYLLYRHRESLSSSRVRIFSPNAIFSAYIAGIIPELGEEDVQTLDFATLLDTMGKKSRNGRGFHGQEEMLEALGTRHDESQSCGQQHLSVQKSEANTRADWIKAKFSAEFCDVLESYVAKYQPTFEDVYFYHDKVCDAVRLKSLYEDRTKAGTLAGKTERVLTFVQRCFMEYYEANKRKITDIFNDIDDENYPDGIIRNKFDIEVNIALTDIRNRSYPLATKIATQCLKEWARREREANVSVSAGVAISATTSASTATRDSSASTKPTENVASGGLRFSYARDALRMDKLFFEDALLLFYADLLAGRVPPEKTVKHILLDEAQDFGVLQHRILKKLYPASRFTVLADTNQALFPEICINDTDTLRGLYPTAEVVALTKSYRSTFEIMNFATGLLGGGESGADVDDNQPNVFLRHGERPTMISLGRNANATSSADEIIIATAVHSPDAISATLEILGELPNEYNTVGILLPTIAEARAFYAAFKKLYPKGNTPRPLMHITGEAANFTKGVMVMAAPLVKGLEFDAVICPAFRTPTTSREGKLFYLICTRALHRLTLVCEE